MTVIMMITATITVMTIKTQRSVMIVATVITGTITIIFIQHQ